jgi:hypothetical protein
LHLRVVPINSFDVGNHREYIYDGFGVNTRYRRAPDVVNNQNQVAQGLRNQRRFPCKVLGPLRIVWYDNNMLHDA